MGAYDFKVREVCELERGKQMTMTMTKSMRRPERFRPNDDAPRGGWTLE